MVGGVDVWTGLQDLADKVAMSPRNFSRAFAVEFGVPPLKFVTQLRTEMALRLLGESERTLGRNRS